MIERISGNTLWLQVQLPQTSPALARAARKKNQTQVSHARDMYSSCTWIGLEQTADDDVGVGIVMINSDDGGDAFVERAVGGAIARQHAAHGL